MSPGCGAVPCSPNCLALRADKSLLPGRPSDGKFLQAGNQVRGLEIPAVQEQSCSLDSNGPQGRQAPGPFQ